MMTTVSGIDERQENSKVKNVYFLGRYCLNEYGEIDYNSYNLYTPGKIYWSDLTNGKGWEDITFDDVTQADLDYSSLSTQQKYQVDWVKGLAIQKGFV